MSWDERDSDNLEALREKLSPRHSGYSYEEPDYIFPLQLGCMVTLFGIAALAIYIYLAGDIFQRMFEPIYKWSLGIGAILILSAWIMYKLDRQLT